MKRALAAFVLAAAALPVMATVSIHRAGANAINVIIRDEPLSVAVDAIAPMLTKKVRIVIGSDPIVNVREERTTAIGALQSIVRAAKLQLSDEKGVWTIRNASEPLITLDVKDTEVREILAAMQKQCGIRNVIVYPSVNGTGTFKFRDVPCRTAFNVVTSTLSLRIDEYENGLVAVRPQ